MNGRRRPGRQRRAATEPGVQVGSSALPCRALSHLQTSYWTGENNVAPHRLIRWGATCGAYVVSYLAVTYFSLEL